MTAPQPTALQHRAWAWSAAFGGEGDSDDDADALNSHGVRAPAPQRPLEGRFSVSISRHSASALPSRNGSDPAAARAQGPRVALSGGRVQHHGRPRAASTRMVVVTGARDSSGAEGSDGDEDGMDGLSAAIQQAHDQRLRRSAFLAWGKLSRLSAAFRAMTARREGSVARACMDTWSRLTAHRLARVDDMHARRDRRMGRKVLRALADHASRQRDEEEAAAEQLQTAMVARRAVAAIGLAARDAHAMQQRVHSCQSVLSVRRLQSALRHWQGCSVTGEEARAFQKRIQARQAWRAALEAWQCWRVKLDRRLLLRRVFALSHARALAAHAFDQGRHARAFALLSSIMQAWHEHAHTSRQQRLREQRHRTADSFRRVAALTFTLAVWRAHAVAEANVKMLQLKAEMKTRAACFRRWATLASARQDAVRKFRVRWRTLQPLRSAFDGWVVSLSLAHRGRLSIMKHFFRQWQAQAHAHRESAELAPTIKSLKQSHALQAWRAVALKHARLQRCAAQAASVVRARTLRAALTRLRAVSLRIRALPHNAAHLSTEHLAKSVLLREALVGAPPSLMSTVAPAPLEVDMMSRTLRSPLPLAHPLPVSPPPRTAAAMAATLTAGSPLHAFESTLKASAYASHTRAPHASNSRANPASPLAFVITPNARRLLRGLASDPAVSSMGSHSASAVMHTSSSTLLPKPAMVPSLGMSRFSS